MINFVVNFLKLSVLVFICLYLSSLSAMDYDKKYKGLYYWGEEVNIFSPCYSGKSYWVSASSWVLAPLVEYVKKSITKPYQPIYIEFRGHILGEELDGFAMKYDGLMRVSELYIKQKDIPVGCGKTQ